MRYHRFDFPDLPLEAFKHYGDRRIKPQGGGGGLPEFISNPLGTTLDAASNIVNGASDALAQVGQGVSDVVADVGQGVSDIVADVGEGVSDVIHDVGTTVAKSPLLSTAAYAILVANQVPPSVAAALVSANAGAPPEAIARNMVLAGVGSEIASQVAPEISQLSDSKLFGQAAGQAAGSAASAAVAGKDPLAAALASFVSSGANVATGEIVKDIPGFNNLPRAAQDSVRSAVSASLQGKDPTMAAVNRAMNAGVQEAVKYGSNIFTGSVTNPDQFDFGVNQGTVDKLAELQAREAEAEDAARAAEAKRLADEENIRQIEAARVEQGATDTTAPTNTEPVVDESYLSKLSPADLERYKAMQAGINTVPDIKPQDLGISQESIDSYERTQQENANAGKLPSQWVPNQDGSGTSTMVHDDGSTTTIDDKGDIVYTTEAPAGNLISDPATQTPQKGGSTVKAPSGTTKATDQLFSSMPTAQKSVVMNMANSGTPLAEAVTAASAFTPVGIKTSTDAGGSKFEGPLDTFLKMVKESDYSKKPVEAQNQQGPNVQQDLLSQPSNYFSYGRPTEIDQLISGEVPNFAAKAGGLAVPMMAAGGNTRYGKYAGGGLNVINHGGKARLDFRKGDAVTGPGDGQSDDIPAMLADGEFVFPADVVAALGNGSTKAGSDKLYEMMHSIRQYHRSAKPKDLPPPAKKSPLDYLKSKKARR